MRYIRFLKVPKTDGNTLGVLVTVTSDLGDDFLLADVALTATLRSPDHNGDIYLRKSLKWSAGMRALPITFDLRNCDLDWPVVVHVGPKTDRLDRQNYNADLPALISAWSSILDPTAGVMEAEKKVERRFIPLSNRTLSIWEETGDSIARHIWDAGVGLAAFFDKTIAMQYDSLPLLDSTLSSATYKKLHVLELGTGCGIVGISLAQIVPDCEVTLTDLPEAREIAQRNIDAMNPAMSSRATFVPLDWDQPLPKPVSERHYDLIIVSDCTYNPDSSPALVTTLKALTTRSPKAIIVLAMKVRHESEAIFFDLMKKDGFVQATTTCQPLPCDEADLDLPGKVDIYIFHSSARPASPPEGPHSIADPSVVSFWSD
ncbi:Nicotinamide N-methyltransferase putative [Macrophomina phaseolina MS6]|uniref:Nicotinamide N-methyltransferase putative n=1 Tax=Macrophomina phaseolina (strain MS6) TaxID=1126212 RepID=K2RPT1_MACPH|nr:Nicotinamide N-methyltransferase putative [Macrophomina phaseolina MS6]